MQMVHMNYDNATEAKILVLL